MKEKIQFTGENYNNVKEYSNYLGKTILNLINDKFEFNIEKSTQYVFSDNSISFRYKIDCDNDILAELSIMKSNRYDISVSNIAHNTSNPYLFNYEKLHDFIENNSDEILEFINLFYKINNCIKFRIKNFLRLSNLYLSDNCYFDCNRFVADINILERDNDNKKVQEKIKLNIEPVGEKYNITTTNSFIRDDMMMAMIYVIRSYLYDQDSMFRYLTEMEG